jgi:hypothetical protein
MSVFSIGMMSATKTKSKKTKESALEIIHDGVVLSHLSHLSPTSIKKAIMTTENKSLSDHFKKELSEKQYYVVADGVVFM